MKALLKYTAILLLMLAGVVTVAGFWLFTTQSGLRWLTAVAQNQSHGQLTIKNISGRLSKRIEFDTLDFDTEYLTIHLQQVSVSLRLAALLVNRLEVTQFIADSISVTLDMKDTGTGKQQSPTVSLPIGLQIKNTDIKHLQITGLPQPLALENLSWRALQFRSHLSLTGFRVQHEYGDLALDGELGFTTHDSVNLKANWRSNPIYELPEATGSTVIAGTLGKLTVDQITQTPFPSHLIATIVNVLEQPDWNITLQAEQLQLSRLRPEFTTTIPEVSLTSIGNTDFFSLNGYANVHDGTVGNWRLDFNFDSTKSDLILHSLVATNADTGTEARIKGVLKEPLSAPPTLASPFELQAHWNNLRWPLAGGQPATVSSSLGQASIDGTLEDYNITLQGDLHAADQHFSQLDLAGKGDLHHLNIPRLGTDYLHGNWRGQGAVSWDDGVKWQAVLTVSGADIADLHSSFPSKLNGVMDTAGTYNNSRLSTDTRVSSLNGTLLGYPLQGNANVRYGNDQLQLKNLNLVSDKSKIWLDLLATNLTPPQQGSISGKWRIAVENTAQWLPQSSGKIASEGTIEGALDKPIIMASLRAEDIGYSDKFNSAVMKAKMNVDMSGVKPSNIIINANDLRIHDQRFESASLKAVGKPELHSIEFLLLNDKHPLLSSAVKGRWLNGQWSGVVEKTHIDMDPIGKWRQPKPSDLHVNNSKLALSEFCFGNDLDESICLTLDSDFRRWDASVRASPLTLTRVQPWMPPLVQRISGALYASAEIHYTEQQPVQVQSRIYSNDAFVEYKDQNGNLKRSEFTRLTLTTQSAAFVLDTKLEAVINNTVNMEADIRFPQLLKFATPFLQQPVDAQLKMDVSNLNMLSLITPHVQPNEGTWVSRVSVRGSIGAPVIIGESRLSAKKVALPRLGTVIDKIDLVSNSTDDNRLKLNLRGETEQGYLEVKAQQQNREGEAISAEITIDGDRFPMTRLPEVQLDISPHLTIHVDRQQVNLGGEIFIPKATFQMFDTSSGLAPSPDIVVIGGEQKQEPVTTAMELRANLKVRFGNEVRLLGLGFDGKLNGEITVEDQPLELTRATGELHIVDGKYSAFGQELIIEQGSLLYAGTPVDNPNVLVRAVRKRSDDIVTGVLVSGEARSPKVTLFSTPAMEDADILSYIVLGHPFNQASRSEGPTLASAAGSLGLAGGEELAKRIAGYFGIDEVEIHSSNTTQEASVTLGKYISPKLYVLYAFGFGQTANALQLQYKINDMSFILKGETGINQGADFLYSIER